MNLQKIIEQFLIEAAALTKGSQRVMNDKNLVINLADAIRDDARSHPGAFPAGFSRTSQKTPDQQLAQWFLENIDNIEREGYDGVVYSRDGVNSDWIVRRYIAGSHNWEDLTGVMNMNLCDWYLLKNRNMLDPNHKDLPKFNSVRDVGYYMTTHYKDKLEKLRNASKAAALNKMAKSIKLVDNDDYRIYTTLNRRAGCALGLGTQWCTANSKTSAHYHRYSNAAMLFQLFPYVKQKDKDGNLVDVKDEDGRRELSETEKYQFDAGSSSFMDITDTPAKSTIIREKFPYLYTDLAGALKEKKPAMEKAFEELSVDPTLQHEDFKIKTYEIDEEIKKLHVFVNRGYFTDEVRKKEKVGKDEQEPHQVIPQISENIRESYVYSGFRYTGTSDRNIFEKYLLEREISLYNQGLTEKVYPGSLHTESAAPSVARRIRSGISINISESGVYDEISHVIDYMHDFDLPHGTSIQVGDKLSVVEFEIMVAWRQIATRGFITPKEIVKVDSKPNGEIKQVHFADGDSYPRTNKMSFRGRPTDYSAFFTDSESAKEAIGTIKLALPNDWVLDNQIKEEQMESIKELARMMIEGKVIDKEIDEDDGLEDTGIAPPSATGGAGGDIGSMGAGAGPTGGGKYPPGTAPTMPESFNHKGTEIMENVDKDVAEMLKSLKKYDMLAESVAPVLGMKTLGEKDEGKHNNGKTTGFKAVAKNAADEYGSKEAGERVAGAVRNKMKAAGKIEEADEELDEDSNPWEKLGADKKEEKKDGEKTSTHKGGEVTKTNSGLVHKGNYGSDKAKDKVEESADEDVLTWMKRFASLGNMKGYGR